MVLWLALLVPAAALVYGIAVSGLFQQSIWYPRGLYRFEIFTLVFAAYSAALLLVRPARYLTITAAIALLGTVASVGIAPMIAVLIFLASAYALGRMVCREPGVVALATGAGLHIFLWQTLVQLPGRLSLDPGDPVAAEPDRFTRNCGRCVPCRPARRVHRARSCARSRIPHLCDLGAMDDHRKAGGQRRWSRDASRRSRGGRS